MKEKRVTLKPTVEAVTIISDGFPPVLIELS